MRTAIVVFLAALTPVCAQEIKFPASFDRLAQKASETVDVTLDTNLLQLAGRFLSEQKADEAEAKRTISRIKGIYVRSFEFDRPGEYDQADVQAIRSQLQGGGWSRIANVRSQRNQENVEVYLHLTGGEVSGLAVLAAEPKELTVVNIVGAIDIDSIGALGGRFGIPRMELQHGARPPKEAK